MTCPAPRPRLPWRAGVGAAAALAVAVPAYTAFAPDASAAGALTTADGYLAEPVSPFDDGHPAITGLDPALRDAVRKAAVEARADGVTLVINSGWRSRDHQEHLLKEAVAEHGPEQARRLVNTPDRSTHVTGDAVDVGPVEADRWLQRHGGAYGLCQIYANEIWHFELRSQPCPPMLPDASAG
ncbi:M15 family metallopeptidase [Catellatospora bangladeshensis]|uniref:D-alanyl-D-alanine carboxypeptidase-like core domain-containing protein n=1 Tax=Catellatospora bangladeshensis TaxID=310355 RepID=A0A8J3JV29_9ACTN|nr:M15 family metallopeptidase [Catellatospora bangladeshensis]GIF84259.1 hypothetical protein Cba03nite_56080 [Catellatospora bangladeshensis]